MKFVKDCDRVYNVIYSFLVFIFIKICFYVYDVIYYFFYVVIYKLYYDIDCK